MKDRSRLLPWLSGAAIIVLLVALAGCGESGGSPSDSAGEAAPAGGGDAKVAEACQLVTQDDATALFGQPASSESGTPVFDPNMIGECLWSWDSELASHLLQFRVWNGEQYYSMPPDAQSFNIGDKGHVRANNFAGVDVEWVQDGKTVTLSYSTVGSGIPNATTKVEQVKALASKVEQQL